MKRICYRLIVVEFEKSVYACRIMPTVKVPAGKIALEYFDAVLGTKQSIYEIFSTNSQVPIALVTPLAEQIAGAVERKKRAESEDAEIMMEDEEPFCFESIKKKSNWECTEEEGE